MATNSSIEWTRHTFNPWRGCTKVSAGCANCYAETLSHRNPKTLGVWGPSGARAIAAESYWREPLKWNRDAEQAGERHRVFCASLADVFEGPDTMPEAAWPVVYAARERLFKLIDATPSLDWLLLTKRPENIRRLWGYGAEGGDGKYRANVWRMTSVENQEAANTRIGHLIATGDLSPIAGLSCEPLIGPVDLDRIETRTTYPGGGSEQRWDSCISGRVFSEWADGDIATDCRINWVIAGGESGPGARPMHPDSARSLRDQCVAAGVPFFFKQWGEFTPDCGRIPSHFVCECGHADCFNADRIAKHNDGDGCTRSITPIHRLGKKAAGRLLDGREWNDLPQGASL